MQNSKEEIRQLFQEKNYKQLYEICAPSINEMLMIATADEFEDFLQQEDGLDEEVFWLYDSAVSGKSILIGCYEEDVTERVRAFLKERLPEEAFSVIQADLHDLYVDIDSRDNLREKIDACNSRLKAAGNILVLQYEDTYCAGAYFLSVEEK